MSDDKRDDNQLYRCPQTGKVKKWKDWVDDYIEFSMACGGTPPWQEALADLVPYEPDGGVTYDPARHPMRVAMKKGGTSDG